MSTRSETGVGESHQWLARICLALYVILRNRPLAVKALLTGISVFNVTATRLARRLIRIVAYHEAGDGLIGILAQGKRERELFEACGSYLLRRRRYDDTLRLCRTLLNEGCRFPEVRFLLGEALLLAGNHDEARVIFLQLIEEGDEGYPVIHNAAFACESIGDLGEAKALYQRAIAGRPDASASRYRLGLTLERLEEYESAIEQFSFVLKDARSTITKAHLALCLLRTGRLPEAERLLKEAHAENPEDLYILTNLAEVHYEAGRLSAAREMYRTISQMLAPQPAHECADIMALARQRLQSIELTQTQNK